MSGGGEAERAAARLERLRGFRNRAPRDVSIGGEVARQRASIARSARGGDALARAWAELCPGELADRTALGGVSGGVLTIEAGDASTRYRVDRLLRSGVDRELIRRSPLSVRRVRVVLGGPF